MMPQTTSRRCGGAVGRARSTAACGGRQPAPVSVACHDAPCHVLSYPLHPRTLTVPPSMSFRAHLSITRPTRAASARPSHASASAAVTTPIKAAAGLESASAPSASEAHATGSAPSSASAGGGSVRDRLESLRVEKSTLKTSLRAFDTKFAERHGRNVSQAPCACRRGGDCVWQCE